MGWETRERGGSYYTRSRTVNGRVIREYIGNGPVAELAAEMDSLKRLCREEEAKAWQAERERMETLVAPIEELCEAVEILACATFLASGYHRHKGEWRKRHEPKSHR